MTYYTRSSVSGKVYGYAGQLQSLNEVLGIPRFPTETNDLNGHLTLAATTINSWLWLY